MPEVFVPDFTRRDVLETDWSGRWTDQQDVANACGDPRDWFPPVLRLRYALDAWRQYLLHRNKDGSAPAHNGRWKFGVIGIAGDLGAGKSTIVSKEARMWFGWGHPFFHGGGWLFGRQCDDAADFYTVADNIPLFSTVAWDEAHSPLESAMGTTDGVGRFTMSLAGMRKKGARFYLPSAMLHMVAKQIRWSFDEIWRPVKVQVNNVSDGNGDPLNDPSNFVVAVEQYCDFPFRRQDPKQGGLYGFGKPDHIVVWHGNAILRAKALTDTFRPVKSGEARDSATKDARQGGSPAQDTELQQRIVGALTALRAEGVTKVKAGVIGARVGVNPQVAGKAMTAMFGHIPGLQTGSKEYKLLEIFPD